MTAVLLVILLGGFIAYFSARAGIQAAVKAAASKHACDEGECVKCLKARVEA